MGFSDILKKSFLENYSVQDLSTADIFMAMLIACLIGLYIFGIYRVVTRKAFYSKSFNISLVALAMITSAIILTIQSSVVISLGMVGALSIVRFRTAVKDPMDLVFLFWSISAGIICGAGLFELAALATVSVSLVILFLEFLPVRKPSMLLVVNATKTDVDKALIETVDKYTKRYKIKSQNMTNQGLDMIIELRVASGGELLRELHTMDGIVSVSLLNQEGEATY